MMWYGVCSFIVILFLIFAWQKRAKCREAAYHWVKWACSERGLQFLDQAIVWDKVRIKKIGPSYLLSWYFKFDYMFEAKRYQGRVVVVGRYLQHVSFSHEVPSVSRVTSLDDYRKRKYANKE